jgi:metal-responsive CopG/Arc/MetJ family transcriptional regulator
MTIDETLLEEVDSTSVQLGTNRSAFIREALRQALERFRTAELERQHAAGYARHPVEPGEFDVWQAEQAWGDA